jgi:hypothetical protein
MALILPITVVFSPAAFFGAGAVACFRMTVDPLPVLESLAALPLPPLGGGAGAVAATLLPRPAPVAAGAGIATGFRVPLVDLAISTIFVRMLTAPPEGTGAFGLRGEMGRASADLPGTAAGLVGERV